MNLEADLEQDDENELVVQDIQVPDGVNVDTTYEAYSGDPVPKYMDRDHFIRQLTRNCLTMVFLEKKNILGKLLIFMKFFENIFS